MPGTYQNRLGVYSLAFWLFMLELISAAFIMTWIFNNNQRSTLSAVLFYFMFNFSGELVELSPGAQRYRFLLMACTEALVTIIWGPKTMKPKKFVTPIFDQ